MVILKILMNTLIIKGTKMVKKKYVKAVTMKGIGKNEINLENLKRNGDIKIQII